MEPPDLGSFGPPMAGKYAEAAELEPHLMHYALFLFTRNPQLQLQPPFGPPDGHLD